jgi:hypothetical protein
MSDLTLDIGFHGYEHVRPLIDDPPFVAIPVFLARQFRHSMIFVNTASGIESPRDLVGKTIGEFATYGHDAGVTAKGAPGRRRRHARAFGQGAGANAPRG